MAKILIVDDSPTELHILSQILEKVGAHLRDFMVSVLVIVVGPCTPPPGDQPMPPPSILQRLRERKLVQWVLACLLDTP